MTDQTIIFERALPNSDLLVRSFAVRTFLEELIKSKKTA